MRRAILTEDSHAPHKSASLDMDVNDARGGKQNLSSTKD